MISHQKMKIAIQRKEHAEEEIASVMVDRTVCKKNRKGRLE